MAPPSVWILGLLQAGTVAAISISRQVQLGGTQYFVPPTEAWSVNNWRPSILDEVGDEDLIPLSVATVQDVNDEKELERLFAEYEEKDDVWTRFFASVVYLQQRSQRNYSTSPVHSGNGNSGVYGVLKAHFIEEISVNGTVRNGPYFIHRYTGRAYQAYRLYPDTSQAFLQSSYQDNHGTHHPLPAAIESDAGLTIAVPSRLYYTPSTKKPLAGVRVGVKDLFHVKGLRTSFGNKAVYNLYSPQNATAVAIQKLIDAGAVVVGKNKLSEFGYGGPYVTEHVDYLLPVNPRGDGYNSPSESSGGSGSAVASYDWLDASVGSDTGGSVRNPAHVNGVLGNRPTQGGVSTQGALPLSPSLDTVGLLARDPMLWAKMNKVLLDTSWKEFSRYPAEIILDPAMAQQMKEYSKTQPELAAAIQNFMTTLEHVTGGTVNYTSFDIRWNETRSPNAADLPLGQVVHGVYRNITAFEQWTEFGREFVNNFNIAHHSEYPHVTPRIRERWIKASDSEAVDIYHEDSSHLKVFRDWAVKHFLSEDENSCSNALFVYFSPPTYALLYKPDVSDNYANPFINNILTTNYNTKVDFLRLNVTLECASNRGSEAACKAARQELEAFLAYDNQLLPSLAISLAGFPDFCVPLGSFDMGLMTWSNSTMKTQALPLGVDIVAAKGCDSMLYSLVEELYRRGVVKMARTGMIV